MGQQRPRDASDLLPPRAQGRPQRRAPVRGRPAPDVVGANGPTAGSGSTSAATSPWPTRSAREIIAAGLENREFIERATADFDAYKAKVESYTLEYAERETGVPARGHPRAGPRVRDGPARDDLLDARHHRAPQRRRQRPRPDRPRPADRPRRPLRQRRQPVAWPEQRPGRRRHGRPPRPPARASSTSRTTRCGRSSTPSGASRSRRSAAGTCRACSTRWSAAT